MARRRMCSSNWVPAAYLGDSHHSHRCYEDLGSESVHEKYWKYLLTSIYFSLAACYFDFQLDRIKTKKIQPVVWNWASQLRQYLGHPHPISESPGLSLGSSTPVPNFLLNCTLWGRRWWLKYLRHCHSCERPCGWNSQLCVLTSSSCCVHLVVQQKVGDNSRDVSAFQIQKHKNYA